VTVVPRRGALFTSISSEEERQLGRRCFSSRGIPGRGRYVTALHSGFLPLTAASCLCDISYITLGPRLATRRGSGADHRRFKSNFTGIEDQPPKGRAAQDLWVYELVHQLRNVMWERPLTTSWYPDRVGRVTHNRSERSFGIQSQARSTTSSAAAHRLALAFVSQTQFPLPASGNRRRSAFPRSLLS
jgi:hypothetical protein